MQFAMSTQSDHLLQNWRQQLQILERAARHPSGTTAELELQIKELKRLIENRKAQLTDGT